MDLMRRIEDSPELSDFKTFTLSNLYMKCLIIAAGMGTRLSARGDSKPLVSLKGIPLIQHVMERAVIGGVTEFHIVIGYNGEKVRNFVEDYASRNNIIVNFIQNDEWKRANGISVLKAKVHIKENFVLLMSDHLFDPQILEDLLKEEINTGEVILAVDTQINDNPLIDIDDVTKVNSKGGRILDIGKELTDYNCFDTGIFYCTPAMFDALEKSSVEFKDDSLSGGMRVLATDGKARIYPIGDRFWLDVDDENAFMKAESFV